MAAAVVTALAAGVGGAFVDEDETLDSRRAVIEDALARAAKVDPVVAVADPFAAGAIAPDGRVGFAELTFGLPATDLGPATRCSSTPTLRPRAPRLVALVALVVLVVLVVPTSMALMGRANWWLPGWLDRILPRLAVDDAGPAPGVATATGVREVVSVGSGHDVDR